VIPADVIGYVWALALGMLAVAVVSERVDRREPTREELATLRRWGWPEPDERGRTADPSGGGTVHWTTALRWIARDEARGDRP